VPHWCEAWYEEGHQHPKPAVSLQVNPVSWMNNLYIRFVECLPISMSHLVCLVILVAACQAVNPQASRVVMAARLGRVLSAVCSAVNSDLMGMFHQSMQKTYSHSKSHTWQTTVELLYEPDTADMMQSGADYVMVSQAIRWGQNSPWSESFSSV